MSVSGDTIRRRVSTLVSGVPEVLFALLFGSRARGEHGPLSDVDVAVFFDPVPDDPLGVRLMLTERISAALHISDVDVAVLNEVPLPLAYRVLRDGVVLFCRDRDAFVAYQARVVSAYLDFAPTLALYERRFLECAAQGAFRRGHNAYRQALAAHRRRVGSPETTEPR